MGKSKPFDRHRATLGALCFFSLLIGAGCTTFPTRGQQVWRSMIAYRYPSEPVGSAAFEAELDRYTASRAKPIVEARLLQNGDETYPAMLDLIANATTRISMETYVIEKDQTTDRFFSALLDAAARGVEVRMLVDAVGFNRGMVAQLGELTRGGVQARVFNPLFLSWTILRGNNRDHRKMLVVDGRIAIVGGINISDKQAGDGKTGWRDTALLVAGPVAHDAETAFAETWEQAGRGFVGKKLPITILNPLKLLIDAPFVHMKEKLLKQPRFVPPAYPPPGDSDPSPSANPSLAAMEGSVRIVASSPDGKNSTIYDLAIIGIYGARERLDVTSAYFVPPHSLKRAILAAAGRGVRVRLLLPGVTDVLWVREAGMKFYGELLRAGVEIYEWPHPILHAKTMIVDGKWLVVGSGNLDSRSNFLSYEANLAVSSPILAEAAHRQFELDLLQSCRFTLDEWLRRDAWQRALEALLTPIIGQY